MTGKQLSLSTGYRYSDESELLEDLNRTNFDLREKEGQLNLLDIRSYDKKSTT